MPVENSYKATIEHSTVRDSAYLHTTSCGKLLDVFEKPPEQGDPQTWILASCIRWWPPCLHVLFGVHMLSDGKYPAMGDPSFQTFGHRGTQDLIPQNVLWYQYSCINFTAKIFPRIFFSLFMQGAVRLEKFEHYHDAHDKKRYDLGILFGSLCQSMESQRQVY